MADFQKALSQVLKWEGGVANVSGDKGGLTNKGITYQTFKSVYRGATTDDLLHITDEQVQTIYRKLYWDKMKGDYFKNDSLATYIFDWVVNSGTGILKKIQGCCGLLADGIIGNNSISKFNGSPEWCFNQIKETRINYYKKIGVGSQAKFLKGWLNRANSYKFK